MFFFSGCNKDCGINDSAMFIPFLLFVEANLLCLCHQAG
ncbi:hypothetical protein SynA1528_01620 [Synechococcus sp. A15-28]|nr:hypothetical protein SynA1528_01620 [Synechococcus sp. A15-28]